METMHSELERLRAENDHLKRRLEIQSPAQPAPIPEPGAAKQASDLLSWQPGSHGLSGLQISRYSRQMLLSSFGAAGMLAQTHSTAAVVVQTMSHDNFGLSAAQARLVSGSALIIGAGGLGSPAALYLAAAGVGRIGIVDQDVVELSNLHRQIIHAEARVGTHKAESAAQACHALNSSIKVGGLPQAA